MRDPMDTCFSAYALHFPYGQEFSFNLEELGKYYLDYSSLMEHWRHTLKNWQLDIQYEELVNNPEPVIEKILNFCGLKWNAECLRFYKSKRAIRTASVNQVRNPVYNSSIKRWEKFSPNLISLKNQLEKLNFKKNHKT